MASNYWLSSQCNHWLFTRAQLETARSEDLRYAENPDDVVAIGIWACNTIALLTKRLNLRQRVTATACTFFRRFYARTGNSYSSTDPALVATTCVYVAAKVEETPVHVRSVVAEACKIWTELGHPDFPTDVSALAEMEFFLFEELDFHLIVHHPYRALLALSGAVGKAARSSSATDGADAENGSNLPTRLSTADRAAMALQSSSGDLEADLAAARHLSAEELNSWEHDRYTLTQGTDGQPLARLEELDDAALQYAWFVVNDTYRADTCLLYPPHLIAIAALWLGLVLHPPSRDSLEASAQGMRSRREKWLSANERICYTTTASRAQSSTTHPASAPASRGAAPAVSYQVLSPRNEGSAAGSPSRPASRTQLRGLASLPMRPAHITPHRTGTANQASVVSGVQRSTFNAVASPEGSTAAATPPDLLAPEALQKGSATSVVMLPPAPPTDALSFLAALNVDMRLVAEIVQEILATYDLWHRLDLARPGQAGMISDGPGMLRRLESMRERRRMELLLLATAPV